MSEPARAVLDFRNDRGFRSRVARTVRAWLDTSAAPAVDDESAADRIDWLRAAPFVLMHLACGAALFVGVSPTAVGVAIALYAVRMFAVTAFYHRYFSHRTFRTSRALQFVFALLGASSVQRGPLWWASHHRAHHAHADTARDPHSPSWRGAFWSHVGWFLTARAFRTDLGRVGDLARYPELRWLDRFDTAVPIALAMALYVSGEWLHAAHPALRTSGAQLLVWGFCISTVALFHATFTINSLAHRFGRRRFRTRDESRNNAWLALITLGEGWHNNHHFFPGSARQGFRWWEIDVTFYVLCLMSALGLVRDLKPVPAWVAAKAER